LNNLSYTLKVTQKKAYLQDLFHRIQFGKSKYNFCCCCWRLS